LPTDAITATPFIYVRPHLVYVEKLKLNYKIYKNCDGKVDAQDVEIMWDQSQVMMKDSVPGAGGFSAGFLLGARRG